MNQPEVNQPVKKSGSNMTIFIVLALALVLFLCFCCALFMFSVFISATNYTTPVVDNEGYYEQEKTIQPERQQAEYLDMDETANVDGLEISIMEFDMEYVPESEYWNTLNDEKYVAVELYLVNASDQSIYYSDFNFNLKDFNNYSFLNIFSGSKEPTLTTGTLPAGEEVRGWITYQVPQDGSDFSLVYTGSYGDRTVEFLLK